MSRKGKLITIALLIVGAAALVVIVAIVAGIFFLRSSRNREIVTPPTSVGVPNGPATTKVIGPEGGSISSADGRITIVIPPEDIVSDTSFSIQPITEQAQGGLGNAYRLEPNGQKFISPVRLSFKYADEDVEQNGPEALVAAYQQSDGSWRSFETLFVDEQERTLTTATTHFTDVVIYNEHAGYTKLNSRDYVEKRLKAEKEAELLREKKERENRARVGLSSFHVSPERATIHVGETVPIEVTGCASPSLQARLSDAFSRALGHSDKTDEICYYGDGSDGNYFTTYFKVEGDGSVYPFYHVLHTVFQSHSHTPTPNVVKVFVYGRFPSKDAEGPRILTEYYQPLIGVTEVTILDWGYKVSGSAGTDTVFSGVVCDLEKPFTIKTSNQFLGDVNFLPSSSTAGTWKFSTRNGVVGGGSGQYTVEGVGPGPKIITKTYVPPLPKIIMNGNSSGCIAAGCRSGGGVVQLILTKLTPNEGGCGQ